jgi:ribonuclease-3
MDYEKLEHVGDAILGSVVTTLLHDLFPYIQPGPATVSHVTELRN